jgi:hypothetical protein
MESMVIVPVRSKKFRDLLHVLLRLFDTFSCFVSGVAI